MHLWVSKISQSVRLRSSGIPAPTGLGPSDACPLDRRCRHAWRALPGADDGANQNRAGIRGKRHPDRKEVGSSDELHKIVSRRIGMPPIFKETGYRAGKSRVGKYARGDRLAALRACAFPCAVIALRPSPRLSAEPIGCSDGRHAKPGADVPEPLVHRARALLRGIETGEGYKFRQISAATRLRRAPRPEISTSTTSPSRRKRPAATPTPAGVPVARMSPGSSVMTVLR